MILFEDTASLAGIAFAAAGVGLSIATGDPRWDGGASLFIAGILAVVALLLARESKGLLIGEPADPALTAAIMSLAQGIDGIGVNGVATIHLAPEQVVAYSAWSSTTACARRRSRRPRRCWRSASAPRTRRCWRSSSNREPRTTRRRGSPSVARGSPPMPDGMPARSARVAKVFSREFATRARHRDRH